MIKLHAVSENDHEYELYVNPERLSSMRTMQTAPLVMLWIGHDRHLVSETIPEILALLEAHRTRED